MLEALGLARLLCAEPLAVWAAGILGSIPGDYGGSARGRVGWMVVGAAVARVYR